MVGGPGGGRVGVALGVAAFLVGIVGYVAFGWRFGGDGGTVPTVLGLLAVAVAVAVTVLRRG
jgi:uncharacterized membrane protein YhhN